MGRLELTIPLWIITLSAGYCIYKVNPDFQSFVDRDIAPIGAQMVDRLNLPETNDIKRGFCDGYGNC